MHQPAQVVPMIRDLVDDFDLLQVSHADLLARPDRASWKLTVTENPDLIMEIAGRPESFRSWQFATPEDVRGTLRQLPQCDPDAVDAGHFIGPVFICMWLDQ